MSGQRELIIQQLQAVGMSGYEGKAYLVLVGAGEPLSGYEVAKRSGVPRSTVYETLGKLVARGAAFEVRSEDEGVDYLGLPAETFLRRLRRDFLENFDALSESLPSAAEPIGHVVHNLQGRTSVLDRARDLIEGARHEIYVSLWSEELAALEQALAHADGRGVDVSILRFGKGDAAVGHTYEHLFSAPNVVLDRVGCRLLVVSADQESVLIGGAVDNAMWGLYSNDPSVLLVAVEFVRHDIAIQVLVKRLGLDEVEELFRTDRTLLRLATGRKAPRLELHKTKGKGKLLVPNTAARVRNRALKK